ncbi:hypothetical protein FRC19_002689 [Serendipita sp. 401]|nr:hypothetical protein FRC19_002689 [Serendipita sp. 401]
MGKAQHTLTNGIPPVLKRNMACHQCRKRKLKCDAQRPCATCKRSHANLLATAMPGVDVPSEPVCTYDELPEPKEPVEKLPGEGGIRAKYERLEARIAELEGQLREREQFSAALLARGTGAGGIHHPYHSPADPYGTLSTSPLARLTISDPFEQLSATIQNSYAAAAAMNMNPMLVSHHQHHHQHPHHQQSPYTPLSMGMDNPNPNPNTNTLLYPNWPTRLPSPALLHHLVEIFFTCHPHAQRLLHRPRFFASLTLPPTHPDFPSLSLLHAICALASLWSPLVEREGMPDLNERPAEEIFQEHARRKVREQRARFGLGPVSTDGALPTTNGTEEDEGGVGAGTGGGIGVGGVGGVGETRERAALNGRTNAAPKGEWFGEAHARWSREEEEKNATEGTSVFQGLQSIVVLTWYYYAHARWVEVWLYTSKALRYAVPMGLNTTPTHGPLLRSWTMPSILGPPKDAIEAEMRRTTFWLAYCYERWQAASTGWAMALDDEDISQVLSLPLKDFEAGLSLLPELRQRISTPRMLTLHIPEQTDAFTLYVKGTILFSKVKNFNIRFKSKYYYAVASSSTHGDRFGTFGAQQANIATPQPPAPRPSPTPTPSASAAAVAGLYQSYSAQPFGFSVLGGSMDQTMLDDQQQQQSGSAGGDSVTTTSSSTSSMMKHIRGPSPDMAPLASLGTSGVLQDAQQSPTNHGGSNGVTTTTTNGGATSATTRTIVKNDTTVVVVDPTSPSSLSLGGPSNPLSSTSQLLEGTRWHPYSAPQELFSPATTGNPPPGPMGAYASPPGQGPERIDPRDTPSFRAVDGLIEGFRTSFPRHLRDPVEGGRVDSELFWVGWLELPE